MVTDSAVRGINFRADRAATTVRTRFMVRAWAWLVVSGLVMAAIYQFAFSRPYSFAIHGGKSLQSLSTLSGLTAESVLVYTLSFAVLFVLYWIGSRQKLTLTRAHIILVAGFALVFNVILLFMYPVDAADVYDYIIRGRMSSLYGLNPFRDTPMQVQSDPFFNFASWRDVPSAYGPAWEAIASPVSHLAGDDPFTNVVAFKLVALAGYTLTALFIALTLHQLAPRRTLLGAYLFAWNPFIVFVTAGSAHNDTVMAACMALSIYCLSRRWYTASTLSAILGALIKFIPVLLLPMIVVVAWRELRGSARLRYLIGSALLGGLLIVAFYAPYWIGLQTLGAERRERMFTSSVATVVHQALEPLVGDDQAVSLIKYGVIGLFGLFYLWQFLSVIADLDEMRPIRAITAILMFYLLVACIWFQGWYVIWVLALAAMLDNTPLRRLTVLFTYLITWQPILYQYVTLRYDGWAALPWRDLMPVAVFIGLAWLYVGWFWLSFAWRQVRRTTLALRVGERLRVARETVGLSAFALADELDLPADALIQYESGNRPLPLDRAEALCERLGLPLSELVTVPRRKAPVFIPGDIRRTCIR